MFFFLPDHKNSSYRNHVAGAFYDEHFVSLEKCIMSEGCWLFTLKKTPQALGARDFPDR